MLDAASRCSTCGGLDPARLACPDCHGWGREVITDCPLKLIDASAWEALRAADLAEHGSWPVAGGWMDQARACVDAVRYVWQQEKALGTGHDHG
jgi:hypothetical protein